MVGRDCGKSIYSRVIRFARFLSLSLSLLLFFVIYISSADCWHIRRECVTQFMPSTNLIHTANILLECALIRDSCDGGRRNVNIIEIYYEIMLSKAIMSKSIYNVTHNDFKF